MNKNSGKTIDEIKKGLACCHQSHIEGIIDCSKCPYGYVGKCKDVLHADALALIQQLERERDAILKDLKEADWIECDHCKHYAYCQDYCEAVEFDCQKCDAECKCKDCKYNSDWEWRGIQEGENVSNTAENEH